MAQTLLSHRIWMLSTKAVRCLPVSSASISSSFSHGCSSYSTSMPSRVSFLSPSHTLFRSLPHNFCRQITFSIQDNDDFKDRVINSDLPVLIDFHAEWCGPCRLLGPRLEKAIAKQEGRVAMAKVDIDDHTDLAIEYGVSAVPTVIAMRGGNIIDKFVGMKDQDQLDSFISKLIGK